MNSRTLWLASYPKSGNTWVRAQLDALVRGSAPDFSAMDSAGEGSNDQMDLTLDLPVGGLSQAETVAALRLSWVLGQPAGTRYLRRKTHCAWLPDGDAWPTPWQPQGAKAIYIVRDPRAIVTSWAHHLGVSAERTAEIMADDLQRERADHLAEGRGLLGSWSRHVTSWLHDCTLPLLVVRYEAMLAEPEVQLRRMAEFADIDATADQIAAAVAACDFNQLAAREIVEGFVEAPARDRPFFRRGEADAWKVELSPELTQAVVDRHGETMREIGYLPTA